MGWDEITIVYLTNAAAVRSPFQVMLLDDVSGHAAPIQLVKLMAQTNSALLKGIAKLGTIGWNGNALAHLPHPYALVNLI